MLILGSDRARKAVRTFLQGFLGIFTVTLLGFLAEVTQWASEGTRAFPSLDPLGKAFVSAMAAGAAGVVTYGWNLIEDKTGRSILIPKSVPDPEPTQASDERAVLAAAAIGQAEAVDRDLPEQSSPGVVETVPHEELLPGPEDEDWDPPIVTIHEPDPEAVPVSEYLAPPEYPELPESPGSSGESEGT